MSTRHRSLWLWIGFIVISSLVAGACSPAAPSPTTSAANPTANVATAPSSAPTTSANSPATATSATTEAVPSKLPLETTTVEIYGSRDPQSMGEIVIAAEKGYFKEEGLDVEVKLLQYGSEVPSGVAGGSIQVGKQASSGIILMAQTMPIKALVRTSEIAGGVGLVVRTDRNINTIKDLEGKKVGLPRTGLILEGFQKLLKAYDVDFNKVTIVNMLPPDIVVAFPRGDIDATWVPEPALTTVQGDNGKLLHTGLVSFLGETPEPKPIGYVVPDMLFVTQDFADKNPNTVLAIMRASKRAIDFINQNPQEAAEILAEPMNTTVPIMQRSLGEFKFYFDFDDESLGKPMDELAVYLKEIDEHKTVPKFTDYADPSFLKQLYPEAVKTTMFP